MKLEIAGGVNDWRRLSWHRPIIGIRLSFSKLVPKNTSVGAMIVEHETRKLKLLESSTNIQTGH